MRYDSDPHIVKRILVEAEALQDSLGPSDISEEQPSSFFEKQASLTTPLLTTLEHFAKLHILNPQFSLSRFSGAYIERELLSVQASIQQVFGQRKFATIQEQVEWNRARYLSTSGARDSEQILVTLSHKIAQLLETYYSERIREKHFAAILNELVGWSEHIEIHGHHDVHAIIVFAEKIARDDAVLDHRTEAVREICLLLQERVFLQVLAETPAHILPLTALELSRVYSPYLLELYEALLEDMEIVAIAQQDYSAFEQYCYNNNIEIYEEYRDMIKNHLKESVGLIPADISSTLQIVKAANVIVRAERLYKRYVDVEEPSEVLGQNLSKDIRTLKQAAHQFKEAFPERAQEYTAILHKVKKFKGEIMKPAIQVYGEYLQNSAEFFQQLPQHQSEWIPILESALACLEQEDELYKKCFQLKSEIDKLMIS